MFILAVQAGKLSRRPHFRKLPEASPRQGFMEHGEYLAIRRQLPADHRDILDFAYLTGWRRGEVLGLEWRDVDRAGAVIRLRPDMSKTRESRVVVLSTPLREVIERRWHGRAVGVALVFHRDGRSLDHFKDVWRRACQAAGMPRKLFHDLQRHGCPQHGQSRHSGARGHAGQRAQDALGVRPLQYRERDGPTPSGRPARGVSRSRLLDG